MDPTQQQPFGGMPLSAQQFSSMAPYMLPNTFDKLRAAMLQQPMQAAPVPDFGASGAMGFG